MLRLYISLVPCIFKYGAETWILPTKLENKLDAFDSTCLKQTESVKLFDFVSKKKSPQSYQATSYIPTSETVV